MNKKAFSLIEILVYLALVSFVILFVFDFSENIRGKIEKLNLVSEESVRRHIFLDLLRRDLCCASMNVTEWDGGNRVFRKYFLEGDKPNFIDIGFIIKDKKLVRVEGIYDFNVKRWLKKHFSTALYAINDLKIDAKVNKNNNLSEVIFEHIDEKSNSFAGCVKLRNRVVE